MVDAVMLWNEPNNPLWWDRTLDPEWHIFSAMIGRAARTLRDACPRVTLVLGAVSAPGSVFLRLMKKRGVLDEVDAVGVHGFPLDWHTWRLDEWPVRIAEIESITDLPVWVTATGASSFGSDDVQVFGLRRTARLLLGRVPRVYWQSLLDLGLSAPVIAPHEQADGNAYYRHFCQGLVRLDGTCKPAFDVFDSELGICQHFSCGDRRLEEAVMLLRRLGVRRVCTNINWADWRRPGAVAWYDRQMAAVSDFETTLSLCFTPRSCGRAPSYASPPVHPEDFSRFAGEVVRRYVAPAQTKRPACAAGARAVYDGRWAVG